MNTVKEFLVETLMRELGHWLSDEDHQVLEEITMVELWEDGIIQLLSNYDACVSGTQRFLSGYVRKHKERLKTPKVEALNEATNC